MCPILSHRSKSFQDSSKSRCPLQLHQILRRGDLHQSRQPPILNPSRPKSIRHRLTKTGPQLADVLQKMGVMPRAHLTIPTRRHRNSWPASPLTVAYRPVNVSLVRCTNAATRARWAPHTFSKRNINQNKVSWSPKPCLCGLIDAVVDCHWWRDCCVCSTLRALAGCMPFGVLMCASGQRCAVITYQV